MNGYRNLGTRYCRVCIYRAQGGGGTICAYIGFTGHRRPCLPGDGCTAFRLEPGKTEPKPIKRTIVDVDQIRRLWEQGLTDKEIAGLMGIHSSTVHTYRKQFGLPNRKYCRKPVEYRKRGEKKWVRYESVNEAAKANNRSTSIVCHYAKVGRDPNGGEWRYADG